MMLRRHHSNQQDMSITSSLSTLSQSANKMKLMMTLMKEKCPSYFNLCGSTRKRILRFLCDNGWVDVGS